MLLMALSCLFKPWFSWMLLKLFTPVPPVQVQVVFQETVVPLRLIKFEHWLPDVAPEAPQRSVRREYGPTATVSQSSHCCAVLIAEPVGDVALLVGVVLTDEVVAPDPPDPPGRHWE